ncbi:oxidoreductase [Planctomycetaceae bacterium SCGC AG-212-F19]|nr:oxidoreductase [Planctomycetaceae bacterium SCGC AG-212-F19]
MRNDSLKNEATYDQDRLDRYLWQEARATGMSRREVLKRFTATLAGAAAAGILPGMFCQRAHADPPGTVITTDPNFLTSVGGNNYEMRWDAVKHKDYFVANDHFYIRNHFSTPVISSDTWQLNITGDGVDHPVTLTYDELTDMEHHTVVKFMECAGNGRGFFGIQQGTPAPGGQWHLGAVGVAKWKGVRLSEVLELACVKETAVDVMPAGLDNPGTSPNGNVRRPMPIEKALDEDTILAFEMNDQPLPADHGGPVRVVVPGWVGIASIKWVGSITVSTTPVITPYNSTLYTLIEPPSTTGPALTTQNVKSAFELPFPATLSAGHVTLHGRSWSGTGRIKHVEFSHDGGATWHKAELHEPNLPEAWVRWKVRWHAEAGSYNLMARATDSEGHVQPDTVPFNKNGYMFWAVVKHPVTVTA